MTAAMQRLRRFALLLVWLGLASAGLPATAQPLAASPVAAEDIEALVATLRDPQAREGLIRQLEILIQSRKATEADLPARGFLSDALRRIGGGVATMGEQLELFASNTRSAGTLVQWLERQVSEPDRRAFWGGVLVQVGTVLLAALALSWVAERALRWPIGRIDRWQGDSWWVRVPVWLLRTALELLPVVVFLAAAYASLVVTKPTPTTRLVLLTLINGVVAAWVLLTVVRAAAAPVEHERRLLPLDDATAAYAYVWARRLIVVTVAGFALAQMLSFVGLPVASVGAVEKIVGLLIAGLIAHLTLQNRAAVRNRIQGYPGLGGVVAAVRRRLGDVWHIFVMLYLATAYLIWALEIANGFRFVATATLRTLVIVVLTFFAIAGLRRAITAIFRISRDLQQRYPRLEARANRYLTVLLRMIEAALIVVAVLLVLDAWHIRLLALIETDRGSNLLSRGLSIVLVVALAALTWELGSAALDRLLARPAAAAANGGQTRLRTLHPLAKNVLYVVVMLVSAIAVLSELGVNVAPLLAGAGVVGLAIGFGAQTLVKDVITGAFIIFENSLGIGDVVTAGGRTGTVEGISIRTIRLRDQQGHVHTIPFSVVDTVVNMTRDFAFVPIEIGVAYRENVGDVFAVLGKITEAMRADPAFAADILAPLEVLGIERFADSAVIIQVRLKTAPSRQWAVRRAFNLRLKERFDAEGIEMPFPHMTVYFGEDKAGRAPPARVLLQQAPAPAPAAPFRA
ncbi:MAG: mechanosensitive ion channel [Alphaproteobacteria bacterium]|nr:mechanosensitive ion channel [Alphaproteobacteria bacterium]